MLLTAIFHQIHYAPHILITIVLAVRLGVIWTPTPSKITGHPNFAIAKYIFIKVRGPVRH